MSATAEFTDYILGQLAPSGQILHRKMFGGVGVYLDGTFCAIISSSNRFYLRVGPNNIGNFQREGMDQFSGRPGSAGMPYYEVPEHIVEDSSVLRLWAREARTAAIEVKK